MKFLREAEVGNHIIIKVEKRKFWHIKQKDRDYFNNSSKKCNITARYYNINDIFANLWH